MRTYLGVDGGGSKTAFLLIDESGRVLSSHTEGSAYYLQIGWDALRELLARGIAQTLAPVGIAAAAVDFSFLGLPSYGEDGSNLARLDAAPSPPLMPGRYRCGNDAVCGWAGALAGEDGINLIAGTGSIGYGEYAGLAARAGGFGELFSDEGSAYWIAREALNLFSRMSDGRTPRGPWYELLCRHFNLTSDLDICAAIYGDGRGARSDIASLAPIVAQAAAAGDEEARSLFQRAGAELAQIVAAVYDQLNVPEHASVSVSYSGGAFKEQALLREPFLNLLANDSRRYRIVPPRLPPVAGAALYAAKLGRAPLGDTAVRALEKAIS